MLINRPRRLRQSPQIRALVRDVTLDVNDFILPLFIHHDANRKQAIASMPGHFQLGFNQLPAELDEIQSLKIPAVILFGIPAEKDAGGCAALGPNNIVAQAVRLIKKRAPNLLVIVDLCFCEYTSHGHCGLLNADQTDVDNDASIQLLGEQAVMLAQAGADIIAPSAMMDGMVGTIRRALDKNGFLNVPILSYAVKYASSFYGPFREAAEGAPQFGDRKTYQMDYARRFEGLREAQLDLEEGADMLMVKPALAYLDVIARIREAHPDVPLFAYQVSGEYAMIHAAAEKGWMDVNAAMLESLFAIRRAGADRVISYFAKAFARLDS